MAGEIVRKALVVSALGYLFIAAFVFWNEGGLTVQKKEVRIYASPAEKRIFIPAIGVDANIQVVHTTASGAVGIPTNSSDVAWFNGSAPIGGAGTALIVGHVDTYVFGPGVFRGLTGLIPGDDIYTSIEGRTAHFRVVGSKIYPEGTDRMAEVIGTKEGKGHLNLITCVGEWNQTVKRYTERLVVFADLVE